ncbi:hypothetical protein EG68_09444 [Paragonimus skrjabini miyazakii]|uniref:Uncharacterized protein n=1 Tax=Paragonimus skrjabini miyazakii TaxID=59628 RepID=A0A8S9YMQ5_9TREM|nr:hypothetical protein EG68_09444 [Paragonimus skrjabini miyazakii]
MDLVKVAYFALPNIISACVVQTQIPFSSKELTGTITVYLRQSHLRETTLQRWTDHVHKVMLPLIRKWLKDNTKEGQFPSTIQSLNIELKAVEMFTYSGDVTLNVYDIANIESRTILENQIKSSLKTFNATSFVLLVHITSINKGIIFPSSQATVVMDYQKMVENNLDYCGPYMLELLKQSTVETWPRIKTTGFKNVPTLDRKLILLPFK